MRTYSIYALVSSHEPERFRYIGATVKRLVERLNGHVNIAKRHPDKNKKCAWISELLKGGFSVKIVELETADSFHVEEVESKWIDSCKRTGTLLNSENHMPYNHQGETICDCQAIGRRQINEFKKMGINDLVAAEIQNRK